MQFLDFVAGSIAAGLIMLAPASIPAFAQAAPAPFTATPPRYASASLDMQIATQSYAIAYGYLATGLANADAYDIAVGTSSIAGSKTRLIAAGTEFSAA